MLMTFPLGVSEFIDRAGNIYRPDSNGQVVAPAVFLGDFLQAGFVPGELVAALVALLAAQGVHTTALSTLNGTVGGHTTALSTLSGRVDPLEADQTLKNKALSGDLVFVVTPATKSTAHGSAANRTVAISLQTAAGAVHTWFNAALATGVAVAKSSEAGTATIPSTTLTFAAGVASVVITEGGAWAAADTNTLTVAAASILGYTVAQKTSVETMT